MAAAGGGGGEGLRPVVILLTMALLPTALLITMEGLHPVVATLTLTLTLALALALILTLTLP